MTNPTKKTVYRLLLGIFMLSIIAVACNNKKDKKDDAPKDDTTKVEPPPPPLDTAAMDKDTATTRPISPVDPVKPGE